jgi:hypothetical protein
MDTAERKDELYGAVLLGFVGFGILRITFGDHWLLRFSWLPIALALVLLTTFLPEHAARPLRLVTRAFGLLAIGLIAFAALLMPGLAANWLATKVVVMLPRWLQMVTLLGWVTVLAMVSALLYSRHLRAQVRARMTPAPTWLQVLLRQQPMTALGAIALYVNFIIVAMACFGGLAFLLHDPANPLFLPAARPEVNQGNLGDFLLWHVLDAIPIVKVPETLKWAAPLSYEHVGAGWLVLLFKVMVIVPVLSGIGHYIKEEGMPDTHRPDERALA